MCLNVVTANNLKKTGVGYKVFHVSKAGNLRGEHFGSKHRLLRRWLSEIWYRPRTFHKTRMISADRSGQEYPQGWHIYTNKKEALDYANWTYEIVKKVRYRDAHTEGTQFGREIIVADEIYIYKQEVR